jgi:Family of unknown function (DUF6338)
VPDSLTALAILALVGVPGYVYLQLVPRKRGEADASELNQSLETIFFGLACALGGVVLSLSSQGNDWAALLQPDLAADASRGANLPALVAHGPFVIGISFLGAIVTAVFAAALVHLVRAAARGITTWRSGRRSSDRQRGSEASKASAPDKRRAKSLAAHERSVGHAVLLLVVALIGVGVTWGMGAWTDCSFAEDTTSPCTESVAVD